jgi:hypothetical protein
VVNGHLDPSQIRLQVIDLLLCLKWYASPMIKLYIFEHITEGILVHLLIIPILIHFDNLMFIYYCLSLIFHLRGVEKWGCVEDFLSRIG